MTPGRKRFVVDASVAIKWIVEARDSHKADLLQGADMVAPALLRIEAGNVLRTIAARQALPEERAIELFLLLQTAPVAIVDHDEPLERRALELALALRHPVCDCVYLALAESLDQRLVTADRRFLGALADTEHAGTAVDLADLDRALSS